MLLRLRCCASVSHVGEGTLDVASRAPRDEEVVVVALLTSAKHSEDSEFNDNRRKFRQCFSGEASGPGLSGWSRALPRTNRPQFEKATSQPPSRAGTPFPLPLFKERCRRVGFPAGRGVQAQRGWGVPARGVLRTVRGQEAWTYHKPGPPNEPRPP